MQFSVSKLYKIKITKDQLFSSVKCNLQVSVPCVVCM